MLFERSETTCLDYGSSKYKKYKKLYKWENNLKKIHSIYENINELKKKTQQNSRQLYQTYKKMPLKSSM